MPVDPRRQDIHMFKYKDLQLVYDVNSGSLRGGQPGVGSDRSHGGGLC